MTRPGQTKKTEGSWYGSYLGHLKFLAGLSEGKEKPDLGSLAELRAAARGGTFEIRALRHIVPYLREDGCSSRHVRVGVMVGQLFAAHPPGPEREHPDSQKRSMGQLMREAEAAVNTQGDEGRGPSAMERHLQILVATDFNQLGARLRGTLARLKQAGITPSLADYDQLLRDLDYWGSSEKTSQYNWVKDFYFARYRPESDGKKKKP